MALAKFFTKVEPHPAKEGDTRLLYVEVDGVERAATEEDKETYAAEYEEYQKSAEPPQGQVLEQVS